MTRDESIAEAGRILAEAGWRPIDNPVWEGGYVAGDLVGGVTPDGTRQFVKNIAAIGPDHLAYGPDTPDEHHEAAAWLVEHAKPAAPAPKKRELSPAAAEILARIRGEGVEAHEAASAAVEEPPAGEAERDDDAFGADGGSGAGAGDDPVQREPVDAEFDVADLGADLDDYGGGAEPLLMYAEATEADLAEYVGEPESDPGPIAYAASDLDALVREKLGRLSQIARAKKGVLQEGWTLSEFASLQNLLQRMERGEASDDATARERFFAISEMSRAMSQIDAARDALEASLEQIGRARDYVGAVEFDPEFGWP